MTYEVEVFYDGECPLCVREIRLLQRLDRRGRIRFTDIAAPDFDEGTAGKSFDELMGRIHARLADGSYVEGVEVFRRLYGAVGFGPFVSFTRLPGVKQAMDASYEWFAKNRLRITGRCEDGACRMPSREAA
jgi:predicted DCC family thiol-disulfide oxidoreductase YuxK